MQKLWLDRETKSELDLKEVGTFRYAQHANDLLISYAIDDGDAKVWDVTDEDPPDELLFAMEEAPEVWAHGAMFDKAIHNGPAQLHLPRIELERWRCNMALAMSHALPGKLASLCNVLEVPTELAKDKDGKRLINLFTKPQPANRKARWATKYTHPEDWERFKAYAVSDIIAMRECHNRTPKWNWDESAVAEWHLDQRINERGFQCDIELIEAGVRAAVDEKARIGAEFRRLTNGVVDRPSLRKQFIAFVQDEFGITLPNTTADTFTQMIKSWDLDPRLQELMKLCIANNSTSTAKFAALRPAVDDDGRFRGGLQFAGASRTRRWAGRLFQPHNLPSRGLPPHEKIERYVADLKANVHDLMHDNLMWLGKASIRAVVIAPPSKKLPVADLSNIEGRVLSWVAGEEWKLQAFRDYDTILPGLDAKGEPNRKGPDLYKVTAASIIGGSPWDVKKVDRDVFGKVPDLASGYQGGVSGYQKFGKAYGVRMADHWVTMQRTLSKDLVERATWNLNKWGRQQLEDLDISEQEWLASETCKLAWRERHPATVRFWYDLQRAMTSAINNWGQVFKVGQFIKVRCVNYKKMKWLVVQLPSGRLLTYFDPHIVHKMRTERVSVSKTNEGTIIKVEVDEPSGSQLAYYGEASEEGKTTRQWVQVFTHGGKATGNVCQTIARDVLTPGLMEAERRGYLPVLSVHDEGVTETPDTDEYSAEELANIIATNLDWNQGLPLAAAGFDTYVYRK